MQETIPARRGTDGAETGDSRFAKIKNFTQQFKSVRQVSSGGGVVGQYFKISVFLAGFLVSGQQVARHFAAVVLMAAVVAYISGYLPEHQQRPLFVQYDGYFLGMSFPHFAKNAGHRFKRVLKSALHCSGSGQYAVTTMQVASL